MQFDPIERLERDPREGPHEVRVGEVVVVDGLVQHGEHADQHAGEVLARDREAARGEHVQRDPDARDQMVREAEGVRVALHLGHPHEEVVDQVRGPDQGQEEDVRVRVREVALCQDCRVLQLGREECGKGVGHVLKGQLERQEGLGALLDLHRGGPRRDSRDF